MRGFTPKHAHQIAWKSAVISEQKNKLVVHTLPTVAQAPDVTVGHMGPTLLPKNKLATLGNARGKA